MLALPKQELHQLVENGCTNDALRQLLDLLAGVDKHRKVYDALIMLRGQWQDLDEREGLNLLPYDETSRHRSRITRDFLRRLYQLPEAVEHSQIEKPAPEAQLLQSVKAIAADTTWEYDLFFCFSNKDLNSARTFCHALSGRGLRVFFSADELRLRGGHNFSDVIEHALQHSRHFLFFCSPNAMQSSWVKIEHEAFFHHYHKGKEHIRGFYIVEGPGFQQDLLPIFYRQSQRIVDPEALLRALTAFTPVGSTSVLRKPEFISRTQSTPDAKTNAADEMAWNIACRNNTRSAYQGYLDKWKNGRHIFEAAKLVEEMQNDQDLWAFINAHSSTNSIENDLYNYLKLYPKGLYAQSAKDRITAFKRKREAETERKRQAQADLERKREAETERKRQAQADLERKRIEAVDLERRRVEAVELARQKREQADHNAFNLAKTRADFEFYLKMGYALHASEANKKIDNFKEQESLAKEARKIRQQERAKERKRKAEEAALLAAEAQPAKAAVEAALTAMEINSINDHMVPIKGGTFEMGDIFGDGSIYEIPVHNITVPDFWLSKYPVTNALWKAVMGDKASKLKWDIMPVQKVSWNDTQIFLKKLNELFPSLQRPYRLPTEAEWEYAAREGGEKVRFGNGKDITDPKEINFDGREGLKQTYSVVGEYRHITTPVGQFRPNILGLHDMSGNVWESCQDYWHKTYIGAPEDGSSWEKGGDRILRVIRGGSWNSSPYQCLSTSRSYATQYERRFDLGFRLAR